MGEVIKSCPRLVHNMSDVGSRIQAAQSGAQDTGAHSIVSPHTGESNGKNTESEVEAAVT